MVYGDELAGGVPFWTDRDPPPPPLPRRGQTGDVAVRLPLWTAPRLGAMPFDYSGVGIVGSDSPFATAPVVILQFTVPDQLQGVVLEVAMGSLTFFDNDELLVDLQIDGSLRLDEMDLNKGGTLQVRPDISTDVYRPSETFIPLNPGSTVKLLVGYDLGQGVYPTTNNASRRPVRGRIGGRFWPKASGSSDPLAG